MKFLLRRCCGETMKKLLIAVFLLSAFAFADEAQDAQCAYTTEAAKAQADQLRIPYAAAGMAQPDTGLPTQMVFGITNSLADDRKASLTLKLARKDCALYVATTEAQQHILYAMPSMEKAILHHRLDLIQRASDKLDAMIADNLRLVDAQNLTRPALYSLQKAKVQLDTNRISTLTGIASPYVPVLSDVPLRQLIADKLANETEAQLATAKLAKQNSWDIKLAAGGHRQVAGGPIGSYGQVELSYSLGHKSIGRHLDNSVDAYSIWKQHQFDDVAAQAVVLKKQIEDTVTIQSKQLEILQKHDEELESGLRELDDVDTSAAIAFRNELSADQLVLRVDIGDVAFRIQKLNTFLTDNY